MATTFMAPPAGRREQHRPLKRSRVFRSVFPPATIHNPVPTPVATPIVDSTEQGEGFGGQNLLLQSPLTPRDVPEQIIWDRAWHIVTSALRLPPGNVTLNDLQSSKQLIEQWSGSSLSKEQQEALSYIQSPVSKGKAKRLASKSDDILEWYKSRVALHWARHVLPDIVKTLEKSSRPSIIAALVVGVQNLKHAYRFPVAQFIGPLLPDRESPLLLEDFDNFLRRQIVHALPWSTISPLSTQLLQERTLMALGMEEDEDQMDLDDPFLLTYEAWRDAELESERDEMMRNVPFQIESARERLTSTLQTFREIFPMTRQVELMFMQAMQIALANFVTSQYQGIWTMPSLAIEHLHAWVERVFMPVARLGLSAIDPRLNQPSAKSSDHNGAIGEIEERKQQSAYESLVNLRINELFDIIVDWESSKGPIEDLKPAASDWTVRHNLTRSFTEQLFQRLLHPGASTTEILQVYISIIRAFNQLEPRGVLLHIIARPIRAYLRTRDDTVKVIVAGLLAETNDSAPVTEESEGLKDLATELTRSHELTLRKNQRASDWDDLTWVPDPIDAAPDFKKTKDTDVVGSLISLFETSDAFVKELQTLIGARLLRKNFNFDEEISVLELLKLRFGAEALQACEVMLRDVLESRRVDSTIRKDQGLGNSTSEEAEIEQKEDIPQIHAKILSRLFWPSLPETNFKVPVEIEELQAKYSEGFEALKQSRKLTWLNSLASATVEIDLEDRVFKDDVQAYQATVIYAFQNTDSTDTPVTKTIAQLSTDLQMPTSLVRSACIFWTSKEILTKTSPDTYRVLESLPTATTPSKPGSDPSNQNTNSENTTTPSKPQAHAPAPTSAEAAAAEAAAAEEAAASELAAKMNIYWQFIVGMLTNQGAMPLPRIIMMLKMAVPGGFPYSNEELKGFLAGKVREGVIEVGLGGNYKILG